MDLKQTRRRGDELEAALLDAAWQQLTQSGYADFTFEAVAARAGTSRTVLYRRWTDREDLLKAAVRRAGARAPIELPDTGNLRDDVVTLLHRASEARADFAVTLSVQLAEYFRETGTTFANLRELLIRRGRSGMELVLERAQDRGEITLEGLTTRVIELPLSLMRHELLWTLTRVPDDVIAEIVDDVWLPLLRARGALRDTVSTDSP
ncbi:TetR/AcrR family transcriptional regulator [Glaciihabitans sp. dw_435]|uniref:TetR/AcrR family transcriptional regulator n=1 Tax=Glaciihabitans sp. dw_435 TaxID=2720081 RepID=UPI001BD3A5D2|nr:TetR/AcrR family transcriptional regulator [Glaciihabitans sp. dw_435]